MSTHRQSWERTQAATESQMEEQCWLSVLLIRSYVFTQALTCMHMAYTQACESICVRACVCVCVCVCLRVCVFARLQFHTELSTVSVSAGISVCHCVGLTCK